MTQYFVIVLLFSANVNKSEAVMFEGRKFMEYVRRQSFVDKFGHSEMHIMKECLFDFGVALVLQKDSPYTEDLGRKIQQLKVRYCYIYTHTSIYINDDSSLSSAGTRIISIS